MKKKKAGKPRHNKDVKIKKSVSLDPWKIKKILKEFPNLSIGIDIIIADWISRGKKILL